MASNDRLTGGQIIGKYVKDTSIHHGLILGTCLEGLNKTTKIPGWTKNIANHLSQYTKSPGRIRGLPNMKQVPAMRL
jgi:hypothetical protein